MPASSSEKLELRPRICLGWLKVQGITSTIVIATVDFVLMLRVWIMYGRPRLFVWLFLFLGISEVTIMTAVDFVAYAQMTGMHPFFLVECNNGLVLTGFDSGTEYVHLGPILPGCYAYNVPRFLTLYAAAPLFVTFIMFAMTIYKCGSTLRQNAHQIMPLWRLFLRDGVLWFLTVFAAAGAALLIWTMRRSTLKQLLVVPSTVVYSIVASRTLLNIKAIMAEEQVEVQTEGNEVKSDILFVPVRGSGSTFASASASAA
ncbi:hypothetical protein MVEN_01425200 [Mycena venus]|uniref:Uncharacterized protein n=1 Tax=Mycena venus TaxID=2733690 RepID=A0A8H6XYR8_9AGAR|nr:hypothetical protein MVEN_01425200 [Mycena venus]